MSDIPPRAGEAITSPPTTDAPWNTASGLSALGPQESYRPLSLMAFAGLILAIGYAIAVTVGGLPPFAAHYWRAFRILVVVTPLAALLIALLARVRGLRLLKIAGLTLAGLLAVP